MEYSQVKKNTISDRSGGRKTKNPYCPRRTDVRCGKHSLNLPMCTKYYPGRQKEYNNVTKNKKKDIKHLT